MQGRPGQSQGGKSQPPLDRSSTSSFRLSELTGRQPVVPKRPPGMTRVEQPQRTPRVARPQREDPELRKPRTWKWWVGCTCVVLLLGVVAAVAVYSVTNLFTALNVSSGSASTAADFLANIKAKKYTQAYSDLDLALTVSLNKTAFGEAAQADDLCYGSVTDYNEVANSAVSSTVGGVQTFTYAYDITRSKLQKPYQLHLTLQKDSDGNWYITDYGKDLGPAPPACK